MFVASLETQSKNIDISQYSSEMIMPSDAYRQELYFVKDNTTSRQRAEYLTAGYFQYAEKLLGGFDNQLTLACHGQIMEKLSPGSENLLQTAPKVIQFFRINSHEEVVPCRLVVDGNTRIGISYVRDLPIEVIRLDTWGNVGSVKSVRELTAVLSESLTRLGMPAGSMIINRSTFYREIGLEVKE